MQTIELLSPAEMAYTLDITEYTLLALVHSGTIPHTYVQSDIGQERLLRFDPFIVTEWMQSNPSLDNFTEKPCIDGLKNHYKARFPHVLTSLKTLNAQFAPPAERKGYSLTKVESKKYGFLYYVRYIENGSLIASRWNTRTNNLEAAERFACENRERILVAYHAKHDGSQKFFDALTGFYQKDSEYMTISANRGRAVGTKARLERCAFINKTVIPYFKKHGIRTFGNVTIPVVEKLQDYLLDKGLKPQTVNKKMVGLRQIFDYFIAHGTVKSNPFRGITRVKPKKNDVKMRGCYEIDTLKGVFNKRWRSEDHRLLCLIIYTPDMRNSEIERMQVKDMIEVNKIRFFDINASKTENGVRIVSLHPFVYARLQKHASKNHLQPDDYLVKIGPGKRVYQKANLAMGRLMGKTKEELSALNITYYSGRSFWKTAMNIENLGDVEEYFMGHKVSANVAKLYNHKDKVGRRNIAVKAKAVFKVLDKYLGLDRG
jgi:site-specific recombinase XerC